MGKHQYLIILLTISTLLHLGVVLGLHYTAKLTSLPSTKHQAKTTIKAKLVFIPTPHKETNDNSETPTQLTKPVVKTILDSNITETQSEISAIRKAQTKPQAPTPTTARPTPAQPKKMTKQAINSQFTGIAGKHLQQYNLQQDANIAAEASRYFRQQKNGAIIDAPNKDRFVSEEQKLLKKTKIRANCDGSARKIAAAMLSLLGGVIDCTKKPDINSFIKQRINKQPHLDGKYKKPLNTQPKSLVVLE